MFISSFSDSQSFNSFYQNIINSQSFIPIDKDIFILMEFKSKNILKSLTSMPNDSSRKSSLQNMFLDERQGSNSQTQVFEDSTLHRDILLAESLYESSEFISGNYYLYPFSRQKFMEEFFSVLLPSFAVDLMDYLMNKFPLIRQIGSGYGSAIILKSNVIENQALIEDINSYCSIDLKSKNLFQNLGSIESIINSQNKNIEYLTNS